MFGVNFNVSYTFLLRFVWFLLFFFLFDFVLFFPPDDAVDSNELLATFVSLRTVLGTAKLLACNEANEAKISEGNQDNNKANQRQHEENWKRIQDRMKIM